MSSTTGSTVTSLILATKENQRYAAVATLAVLLWDIIVFIPQDYEIARSKLTTRNCIIMFIIYCVTRLASLAYVFGIVIFTTLAIGDCNYGHNISMLYPFTIPLTILPFLLRVFILYDYNKYVVAFFSTTWLSVLGGCIAVPIGSIGTRVATTEYCSHSLTVVTYAMASICPLVHETLIFVATSWAFTKEVTVKNKLQVIIFGRHIPVFSKCMLRDGQAYYLIILLLNLFFVVLSFTLQTNMTPCTITVVMASTMSSHVYRNMRLGHYSSSAAVINRAMEGLSVGQPSEHSRRNDQRIADVNAEPGGQRSHWWKIPRFNSGDGV